MCTGGCCVVGAALLPFINTRSSSAIVVTLLAAMPGTKSRVSSQCQHYENKLKGTRYFLGHFEIYLFLYFFCSVVVEILQISSYRGM